VASSTDGYPDLWKSAGKTVKKQTKLASYRAKRDPQATPEPFDRGKRSPRPEQPVFVVQRHDARRLHYDFRLERDGVLASWAVPKGVPMEPGSQHLAVHVEDHPLDYAAFEGEIPKGSYGAGTVEIWDRGTYELVEEKRNGGLTVRLHGEKLEGLWALIPARLSGDEKNWLILRKREDGAAPVERGPSRRYRPMLATVAERLPQGQDWLFEPKWDGYRALAYVRDTEVELRSRRDNDLTERFSAVARALPRALRTPSCVLDGEVCALDEQGRSSFSLMQQGLGRLVYYVFDVLEIDGRPVLDRTLTDRRELLEELLDGRSQTVRLSGVFDDGEALLEAARDQGLEGVMAKRASCPYEERRSRNWLKVKVRPEQEFVVVGYTKGQGRRTRLGALVVAVNEDDGLRWVGNVGTGFTERTLDELLDRLRPLERSDSPLAEVPKMPRVRKSDVVWVEPELVVQVQFAEWTHDGHLRAPAFLGMRDDKRPEDVRREVPGAVEPEQAPEPEAIPSELRKGKRVLKLSNLDKPFWPEEGITKGDLLAYYRAVAPVLVPHLKDRPFTMKRYPDGWEGDFFFQKDAPKHMPDWIPTETYRSTSRESRQKRMISYPLVNDELALLWMVNMGCIDMNAWYSRVDRPERPDFVLFDLDPSPDVGFPETIEVALLVRALLEGIGLRSFAKTSGADGIHVLVPIERRWTYADTREFSEIVARALVSTHRGLVTTEWNKAKRRGVLIDSNQNGEGKTIASVYSVRPKAGAPVSTPLRWEEVDGSLDPSAFTMGVVLDRIEKHGDLYEGVLTEKQSLSKALAAVR
jgi:bifunctional non-homologous end joining protein LigD